MASESYIGNDIYCDLIIPRKVVIQVVKETANVLAYHHTKPHWPVHIVVTPKTHIDSLLSIDANSAYIAKELLAVVQEVAADVNSKHGACRVLTNLGDYQDSKHLHIHISQGDPVK